MVRIQWIMKPFPGQNDQAMENVKKFAKLWKEKGANKCTVAIMSGKICGDIFLLIVILIILNIFLTPLSPFFP